MNRENRPHPVANFLWGLFSPVVSWWGFFGMIPFLIEASIFTAIALVAILALQMVGKAIRFVFTGR